MDRNKGISSAENSVFSCYAFWAGVLVLKMVFMSLLTGLQRFRKRVFANPEDMARIPRSRIQFDDDDVERPRRAHLNDLENVLPYLIIGYIYVLVQPDVTVASWIFRIGAISRLVHTFVYAVVVVPQPARGIAFWGTLLCTIYMSIEVLVHFS